MAGSEHSERTNQSEANGLAIQVDTERGVVRYYKTDVLHQRCRRGNADLYSYFCSTTEEEFGHLSNTECDDARAQTYSYTKGVSVG